MKLRMKASDSVALQSFAFSNLQATFKSDEGKPNHWVSFIQPEPIPTRWARSW